MSEFTTIKGSNSYRGSSIWERNVVLNIVSVELPTTALQTNDITWLMYVPEGAIVTEAYVKADAIDSGTSIGFNIGDTATTNLFFNAVTTVGRAAAGMLGLASTSTARYTKFASATRIKLTVTTTAQTAAAGTLMFGLEYIIDSSNSISTATGETPITITA